MGFAAIDAAASGAQLAQTWLTAISDNVANLNTVRPAGEAPFRARLVVAQALPGTAGVRVAGIAERGGQPVVSYDPENPLADENGYITRPQVDLSEEMTNLLVAQRLYQANLSVASSARESYTAALQVGRR